MCAHGIRKVSEQYKSWRRADRNSDQITKWTTIAGHSQRKYTLISVRCTHDVLLARYITKYSKIQGNIYTVQGASSMTKYI